MAILALDTFPLGKKIPSFSLPDVLHEEKRTPQQMIESFSKGLLVIFLCQHCPYVQHFKKKLIQLAHEFTAKGLGFLGICSNDPVTYPQDAPHALKEMVEQDQIPFPILFDETQEVAKAFFATCTPDFFLFNQELLLVYHGRFDASTPKNGIPVTGNDLHAALEAVVRGTSPQEPFSNSLGCSIKWKS